MCEANKTIKKIGVETRSKLKIGLKKMAHQPQFPKFIWHKKGKKGQKFQQILMTTEYSLPHQDKYKMFIKIVGVLLLKAFSIH